MNLVRGGAFTTLGLLMAMGCGSAEVQPAGAGGGGGTVTVPGPDGGVIESPPAPPPPLPDGEPVDGVFVSASRGIEGADASKNRPVKTLAEAIPIAQKKQLPVIACAETYKESVALVDGVTMYGYFDCSGSKWKRAGERAKIESPTSPAVVADGLTLLARFEGFDIVAPNAAPASAAASSYGMIVKATKNLTLAEISITAGDGQDGVDGVEPSEGNTELSPNNTAAGGQASAQRECANALECGFLIGAPGGQFNVPSYIEGGAGGVSKCRVGPNGGPGGAGGWAPVSSGGKYKQAISSNDASGRPLAPPVASATAPGGMYTKVGVNPGANGTPGNAGAMGANGTWTFGSDGFVPGDGMVGANGLPGQGGGGGAGTTALWWFAPTYPNVTPAPLSPDALPPGVALGASGAGGGVGGCGGIPGTPGKGGGASIGLFVSNSDVVINGPSLIRANKGGRGGKGSIGTIGTEGAAGGSKVAGADFSGSAGGKGGNGGAAGLSGHGAPGPSIALVFSGNRPVMTQVDLVAGTAGAGAAALTRDGQTLPAVTGVAKQEHQF
jgi:hypothetical protein